MTNLFKYNRRIFAIAILFFLLNGQGLTDVNCEQQRRVNNLLGNKGITLTNNLYSPDISTDADNGANNTAEEEEEGIRVKRHNTFSPRLKAKAFVLPASYSNLQIPTSDTAHQSELESSELLNRELSEPFLVSVTLRIKEVNIIDELNQEITFTADIILEWTDHVIKYITLKSEKVEDDGEDHEEMSRTLDQSFIEKIWKPDVFIENLVKVQHAEILSPPASIKLNQVTGEVFYWTRMRMKIGCNMDFRMYPVDIQKCKVQIRSGNYETSEMLVHWRQTDGAAFLDDCNGTNFDLQVANVRHVTKEMLSTPGKTRKFDVLQLNILARRNMSYHIVQTYLPSIFFIVITWLCFLLPPHMIEARIGISMTTLLTLTAMFASVRESTPVVSYVRAIDIWMLTCIFFIFLTLLEFTVVLWLRYMKTTLDAEEVENQMKELENANLCQCHGGARAERLAEHEIEVELPSLSEKNDDVSIEIPPSQSQFLKIKYWRRRRVEFCQLIAELLERFGFLIFSFHFILFCCGYWYWILIDSNYLIWKVDKRFNCPGK